MSSDNGNNLLKRQSFYERFCDDLCEEILQYLPLEDKLRLECVSQQFQRTVFRKHSQLIIDNNLIAKNESFQSIESLLKKCPNVRTIHCSDRQLLRLNEKLNELIELFVKYCRRLIQVNSDLFVTQYSWHKLLTIIDSNSFTIFHNHINPIDSWHLSQNNCHSLSFVKELHFKGFPFNSLTNLIEFKNLRTISIRIDVKTNDEDSDSSIKDKHFVRKSFETLVERNKSLKCLTLCVYDFDSQDLSHFFNQLSKLKSLTQLKLFSRIGFNDKSLAKSVNQMALKCLNLKSISSILRIDSNEKTIIESISLFNKFQSLKRLSISLISESIEAKHRLQISLFEGLSDLTHLTVESILQITLDLRDIDVLLPKLRYLEIRSNVILTDKTLHMLSRLSFLEEIILFVDNHYIRKQIEIKMSEKCRKIKRIVIGVIDHNLPDFLAIN